MKKERKYLYYKNVAQGQNLNSIVAQRDQTLLVKLFISEAEYKARSSRSSL